MQAGLRLCYWHATKSGCPYYAELQAMEIAGADSPIPNYHYKMATALGGIYFFYMSEKFLKVIVKRKEVHVLVYCLM